MSEYIICNAVPIFTEAQVSLELLTNQTSQILDALHANQAEKKKIVISKRNQEILSLLQEKEKGSDIEIVVVEANGGFVFGNSTAVVKVIEGEKPMPSGIDQNLPVYSVEQLLNSKEKMVHIEGSAKKKGAFTFQKKVKPEEILKECGVKGEFKGMYFGYPMGILIGSGQLGEELEVTTDYIQIFDESDCILDQLIKIVERFGKESCGRCVFGHEGVTQSIMILRDMAQKKGKSDDIELLLDLCSVMQKQALCDIGMSAAKTVKSALENFREEIEEHITKKTCKAVVCSKFVTYHILADLCNGCTDCMDACEEEAILGKKKFIHVIDQEECNQCGSCVKACEEGAIIKAGAMKPKCPKKPIPCK